MTDFVDQSQTLNRRGTDPLIELIAHKVGRMEQSMDKLTEAITKLAVVEERQAADRQALERAFGEIAKSTEKAQEIWEKVTEKLDKMDKRIDDHSTECQGKNDSLNNRLMVIEQALPETNRLKEWAYEGIKYLAVGGIMYFLLKAGVQIPQ